MWLYFISAFLLFSSGIAITISGAILSIYGILLFVPDKEIYNIVLQLAIAFEIGKITAATFLFHVSKNKTFPSIFKGILLLSILSLILISIFASYVHLNNSVSKEMRKTNSNNDEIISLQNKINELKNTKNNLENQINNLPNNSIKGRIKLYNTYNNEKIQINNEIKEIELNLNTVKNNSIKNDRYDFLNDINNLTGLSKQVIITMFLLFLAFLVDPLAITLILAASYIIKESNSKEKKEELKSDEIIKLEYPVKDNTIQDHIKNEELIKEDTKITFGDSIIENEILEKEEKKSNSKKTIIPIILKENNDEV